MIECVQLDYHASSPDNSEASLQTLHSPKVQIQFKLYAQSRHF